MYKRWRESNPEKVKKITKKWLSKNPDYHKEYQRQNKQKNTPSITEYQKNYQRKVREKLSDTYLNTLLRNLGIEYPTIELRNEYRSSLKLKRIANEKSRQINSFRNNGGA